MRLSVPALVLVVLAPLGACGGGNPPLGAAHPPLTPSSAPPSVATTASSSTVSSAAATSAAVEDDPTESAEPIAMQVVLPAAVKKGDFPKATTTDGACWKGMALDGTHDKDFAALISRCGAPTGLLEYAKPVVGHLHYKTDKRDTFTLKLRGGYCYRYFAVGDASTQDVDILITTPGGAIIATDHGDGPTAIIMDEKPWCATEDSEYQFHVEVDGTGKGRYAFGVWARPQ